jgi:hypothetical protein
MRSPCYVSILSTCECLKLFMYKYVMAPEPISKAYFINPSHQSVCLYVHPPLVCRQQLCRNPPIGARQRLGNYVIAATNTHATTEKLFVGRLVCYAVRVISRKVSE